MPFNSSQPVRAQLFMLINYLTIFLVGFLFVYLFFAGLPFSFNADYLDYLKVIKIMSFQDLIALTINPLTPGWFFMEGMDMAYLRPVQYLIFKIHYHMTGALPVGFGIAEAMSCGFLLCLMFNLIFQSTQSTLYGWLGVLLYLSFPNNYFIIKEYIALAPNLFLSLLKLTVVYLFGLLTFHRIQSKLKFMMIVVIWYLIVLIAIKMKSAEKILPPFFIIYLLIRFQSIIKRIGKNNYLLMSSVVLFMMVSVVPMHSLGITIPFLQKIHMKEQLYPAQKMNAGSEKKEELIRTLSIKNMYQRLIHDPEEEFPLSHIIRKKAPQSLTASYGFFLGWGFWILIAVSFFILPRLKKPHVLESEREPVEFLTHFFWLFILWSLVVSLGFAGKFTSANISYLSYIYLPSIPLFFITLSIFARVVLKK